MERNSQAGGEAFGALESRPSDDTRRNDGGIAVAASSAPAVGGKTLYYLESATWACQAFHHMTKA